MGRPAWLAPALAFAAARPWLTLTTACLALMLPSVLFGVKFTHSFILNQVWARQFSDLVREGVWYPRWLPHSFEGLGSPAFYFYAPLPYHLCAAVDTLSLGLLPTEHVMGVAAALLLLASGIAMRAWLRDLAAGPGYATLGALAYMAAPYHLLDHYVRGAFGEFAAYAALPVVALGIRRLGRGQGGGEPLLILGYAALVLSHLPTALLASVTMIPVQVAWCAATTEGARRRAVFLCRCAAAGAVGLAISAAYLLPALTSQELISSERLWTPYHQPQMWFLLTPDRWPHPAMMVIVSTFAAAAAILLGATVRAVLRASPATGPSDRQILLWACVGLLCLVLMTGVVPQAWTAVPLMAKAQFPWRLLTIVDFCVATAASLALAGARLRSAAPFALAAVVAAPGVLTVAAQAMSSFYGTSPELAAAKARVEAHVPDAIEYLPAGHDFRAGADRLLKHADLDEALAPLRGMPPAVAEPAGAAAVVVREGPRGALRVQVTAQAPARVVLRRFHFPIWRVTRSPSGEEVPAAPQGPYRLLSFAAPPGVSEYEIAAVPLPSERIGWALSVAGALVLAGQGLALRRRRAAVAGGLPAERPGGASNAT